MKNKLISKSAKLVMLPIIALNLSLSCYAGTSAAHKAAAAPAIHATSGNKLKQTLATSVQKSQFSYVSQKLSQFNLPKSLALIPVIESNYNSKVVSPKGAGGLWQLMPGTAKEYGISSSDRFQLAPSTVAALKYFSKLHQQFGNWQFAIAAYNAGSGRVQKALSKNPTATSVQQLQLPQETKQYVQKFNRLQGELNSVSA